MKKNKSEEPRITKRQSIQTKMKEYPVKHEAILLDFLIETLKGKSRNNCKSLLSKHLVLVDGTPVTQFDFKVFKGDIVQISPRYVAPSKNQTRLKILLDNEDFFVIDKPSGLLSVATDKEKTVTAYRLATDYVRIKDPKNRLFVVHRIDKDTSGVLLFAKSNELKEALQKDWNNLVEKREYVAIVEGVMEVKEGTRTSWLLETKTNLMYSSSHRGDGQKATTHYKVIKENNEYSMLDVLIDSGRKNQIRVHLKELGHMVVGDNKYHSETNPLKRLGLHAKELKLTHPLTQQTIRLVAPIPKEFNKLFNEDVKEESTSSMKIMKSKAYSKPKKLRQTKPKRRQKN